MMVDASRRIHSRNRMWKPVHCPKLFKTHRPLWSAKVSAARFSDAAISFMVLNFPTHTKAKHNNEASSLLSTLVCGARQDLPLCGLCRGKWKLKTAPSSAVEPVDYPQPHRDIINQPESLGIPWSYCSDFVPGLPSLTHCSICIAVIY